MKFTNLIIASLVLLGGASFAQNAPAPTTPPAPAAQGPNGGHHHHWRFHHCVKETLKGENLTFKTATKAQREAARQTCHEKFEKAGAPN